MFADMKGYTSFTERSGADEATRMLNTYWARLLPLLEGFGADVQDLIGDEVMAIFRGDDHATRAARAALAFQAEAASIAEDRWPRFRAGVNTGMVTAGIVGADTRPAQARRRRRHRQHRRAAPVRGAGRLRARRGGDDRRLPPGSVAESGPPLELKGKEEPVNAYVLRSVTDRRREPSDLPQRSG